MVSYYAVHVETLLLSLTTVVILFRSFAILSRQWEVDIYLLSSAQEYCTPQVTVFTILSILISNGAFDNQVP